MGHTFTAKQIEEARAAGHLAFAARMHGLTEEELFSRPAEDGSRRFRAPDTGAEHRRAVWARLATLGEAKARRERPHIDWLNLAWRGKVTDYMFKLASGDRAVRATPVKPPTKTRKRKTKAAS